MAFDYAGAKAAGYSDQEIQSYLGGSQQNSTQGSDTSSTPGQPSTPQPQWSDLPGNILPSAENLVGGVAQAALHPIQTAKNLINIPLGVGEKIGHAMVNATGTDTSNVPELPGEKTVDNLVSLIQNRYGSLDKAKNTAITDPVGFMADLSTLLDGVGAGADALGVGKAANIGSTADVAAIPKVSETADAANAVDSVSRRMARNVIAPDTTGSTIGNLSKEENIAKNVMDVTKSGDKYGIAKDIEGIYDKVNAQKSKLLAEVDKTQPPIPISDTGSAGAPSAISQITDPLLKDPTVANNKGLFTQVSNDIENRLREVTQPGNQGVTMQGLDQVGRDINDQLKPWFKRGSPMVTEADQYNALLEQAKQNIDSLISKSDPRVKELVNVQANLIPSYKGVYANSRAGVSVGSVRGPTSAGFHALNVILDPLQTILSRNPNSDFAQRLNQLVPGLELGKTPLQSIGSGVSKANIVNTAGQITPTN